MYSCCYQATSVLSVQIPQALLLQIIQCMPIKLPLQSLRA